MSRKRKLPKGMATRLPSGNISNSDLGPDQIRKGGFSRNKDGRVDNTESRRRMLVRHINDVEAGREALEERFGQVWDTAQLGEDFIVESFLAPFVLVIHKKTQHKGTLVFQHRPRFYWEWTPEGSEA